ncbi:MAG: hypothetical protein ACYTFN_24940, partial [Planctomycetota bacterium]
MKKIRQRVAKAVRRSLPLAAMLALALLVGLPAGLETAPATQSVIVQAASMEEAAALVREAGGMVTHELRV